MSVTVIVIALLTPGLLGAPRDLETEEQSFTQSTTPPAVHTNQSESVSRLPQPHHLHHNPHSNDSHHHQHQIKPPNVKPPKPQQEVYQTTSQFQFPSGFPFVFPSFPSFQNPFLPFMPFNPPGQIGQSGQSPSVGLLAAEVFPVPLFPRPIDQQTLFKPPNNPASRSESRKNKKKKKKKKPNKPVLDENSNTIPAGPAHSTTNGNKEEMYEGSQTSETTQNQQALAYYMVYVVEVVRWSGNNHTETVVKEQNNPHNVSTTNPDTGYVAESSGAIPVSGKPTEAPSIETTTEKPNNENSQEESEESVLPDFEYTDDKKG